MRYFTLDSPERTFLLIIKRWLTIQYFASMPILGLKDSNVLIPARINMAQTRKEKLAALAIKRNQFMETVFEAKMKRANEVKEYKEFSSVVTFIDEDEAVMLETSFDDLQAQQTTPTQQPKADAADLLQDFENAFSAFDEEENDADTNTSDFWDKRYQ